MTSVAEEFELSKLLSILLFDEERARALKPSLDIHCNSASFLDRRNLLGPRDEVERKMVALVSRMIDGEDHKHVPSESPPAFCVDRRPLHPVQWKRVFGRIRDTCPVLQLEDLARLTDFVSEGLPPPMLEDCPWNCFELMVWLKFLNKARTESMEPMEPMGLIKLPLPRDASFCGSTRCVYSMAVKRMLHALQEEEESESRARMVLDAAFVYVLAVQRCGTAGNLHTAGLLRTALGRSVFAFPGALRVKLAEADMTLLFKIIKCSKSPSWRLWDLVLAQLVVGAVASTCSHMDLAGTVIMAAVELGHLPEQRPGRKYIVETALRLLPVPKQSMCILTTVLQAMEKWAVYAVARHRDVSDFVVAASFFSSMCSASALCRMLRLQVLAAPAIQEVTGASELFWAEMNTVAETMWQFLIVKGSEAFELFGLAALVASEEFASAWLSLLQLFCREGWDPFRGDTARHIAYFTTEECQALLPDGQQYVQLRPETVDRFIQSPAFFDVLIMGVMYETKDVAGLGLDTVNDLWRRASCDEVRAASHARLVDFVTRLDAARMEAGLQALFRLLPDSDLWLHLWRRESIDAGLRHKYRAWLRMWTISDSMDQALYIFWGEALCTRAIGHIRAMRLMLQRMPFMKVCVGFRRHQVRETIKKTVRTWAKKAVLDTPVYRDPVRMLANFALDSMTFLPKEADPAEYDCVVMRLREIAHICPCALADRCRTDVDVLNFVVNACSASDVAVAAVQDLLKDETACAILDAEMCAVLEHAMRAHGKVE